MNQTTLTLHLTLQMCPLTGNVNFVEIKISENVLWSSAVDIFRVSIFTLRLFNSALICSIKSLIVSGEEKMSDEKCSQDEKELLISMVKLTWVLLF